MTPRCSGRSTTPCPSKSRCKTGLSDSAYTEILTGDPGDGAVGAPASGPATDPPGASVKEGDIVIIDATVAGEESVDHRAHDDGAEIPVPTGGGRRA